MTRISSIRFLISIVALALGLSAAAQAGPPLICPPIQIGEAKSLGRPMAGLVPRATTSNTSFLTPWRSSLRTLLCSCAWRRCVALLSMRARTHRSPKSCSPSCISAQTIGRPQAAQVLGLV